MASLASLCVLCWTCRLLVAAMDLQATRFSMHTRLGELIAIPICVDGVILEADGGSLEACSSRPGPFRSLMEFSRFLGVSGGQKTILRPFLAAGLRQRQAASCSREVGGSRRCTFIQSPRIPNPPLQDTRLRRAFARLGLLSFSGSGSEGVLAANALD